MLGTSRSPPRTVVGNPDLLETDGGNDAADVGRKVVDFQNLVDDAPIDQGESGEVVRKRFHRQPVDQAVIETAQMASDPGFLEIPVQPVYDVISLFPEFDEPGNRRRWLLKIRRDPDSRVAASEFQSGEAR